MNSTVETSQAPAMAISIASHGDHYAVQLPFGKVIVATALEAEKLADKLLAIYPGSHRSTDSPAKGAETNNA